MNLNFNDFQKQDIKFDVNKLQNAYKELLTIKGFSGVDGVSNFGAISLTQIPGDPDSIKGKKARGMMVRYIVDNNVSSYEELLGFNLSNYSYNEAETLDENHPVFTR